MATITVLVAFIAGVASFLSPCVLPLIPGFLAYLSGTGTGLRDRLKLFLNSVAYVAGFSSVFALLGVLLNTVLQSVADSVQLWLSRAGGVVIILFGLHLIGLIRLSFLQKGHAIGVRRLPIGYATSFIFGAAFAVGWSPCVGAVLGSVLALAATQPGASFALLLAYALGLGLPFLIVGLFSSQALSFINRFERFLKYFNVAVGIFLIILGILVFTQTLNLIANWSIVNAILLR